MPANNLYMDDIVIHRYYLFIVVVCPLRSGPPPFVFTYFGFLDSNISYTYDKFLDWFIGDGNMRPHPLACTWSESTLHRSRSTTPKCHCRMLGLLQYSCATLDG